MYTREEQEFLDRLNAPEEERKALSASEQKTRKMLFIRNILNGIFMLLALVAMIGIGYAMYKDSQQLYTSAIGVGLVAVLIKMVEATMRMSNMLQKPQAMNRRKRTHSNH